MSSSPITHSQASLSTSASQLHDHDIPLETLVSHLVASKRSLTSISTVWKANEIVTSARAALEESVRLSAKTGFLRTGISEQAKILRHIRSGIEDINKDGQQQFKAVISTLDQANGRLEDTMNALRNTMVQAAFRPPGEEPRSLSDFVNLQDIEAIRHSLKDSIRNSRQAQEIFDASMLSFDDDFRDLKSTMTSSPTFKSSSHSRTSLSNSPIPENLQALEHHAEEMAALLESLVKHFDLCVNAIRHTEGGYAAVRNATTNQPPGAEPVSMSGVMTTSTHDDQPLTEAERKEMLTVLQKDAHEVDDVVDELRENLTEMEHRYETITDHVSALTITYNSTVHAYKILESISEHLPAYLISVSDFRIHWDDTKAVIQEQLEELESMRQFYEQYYASYDKAILEWHRRRENDDMVKTIIRKAFLTIEKIRESDIKDRETFELNTAEFFPNDLWVGIADAPPKWEARIVDQEMPEIPETLEIGKSVVDTARKRERGRERDRKVQSQTQMQTR